MRNSWFFLMLLLVGCNGNDGEEPAVSDTASDTGQPQAQHVPEITGLMMSPGEAFQMESGGFLTVSVEISFRDAGLDIDFLGVRMPDGSLLRFDQTFATETGTFSEELTMSTEDAGAYEVEFWLIDRAADRSASYYEEFKVLYDIQSGNWTSRMSGLPYTLNDVVWDGDVFIAVGSEGVVLTSVDGIEWIERESTTDATLHAVAYHGSDIYAVGYEIVLLSTDHGETWVTKAVPDDISLRAIANTASKVVVVGELGDVWEQRVMISEDRGDTWQEVDSWRGGVIQDLIYRDGLFVAATRYVFGGASLSVSSDGESWDEIVAEQRMGTGFEAIIHDGLQFIVTGHDGWTLSSLDGLNWTIVPTPVRDVLYSSAASNGSKIVLAGGYICLPVSIHDDLDRCAAGPGIEIPAGISSTDGGLTWDCFNIDGDFVSHGMAWGNGRFVSVGEGAIYTAD